MEWDLLDPTPDVQALFAKFDAKYFNGKLSARVKVAWSTEMKLDAGEFVHRGRRNCSMINLSEPLLKFRTRTDLLSILLHEMIHAYLYWTYDKDWQNHGPKFKQMMRIINETEGTHVSEYHNFRAEVEFYRSNETASSSASTTTTTKERTLNFYFQNKKRKEPAASSTTMTKHEQGETALPSKASEKEYKQDKQEEAEAEAQEKTSAESKTETLDRRKRTKRKKGAFVDLTQEEEDPPTKQTSTTTTTTSLFSSAAIQRQLQEHVRELNASSCSSSSSSSPQVPPQDSQQQEASCPVCGHLFPPSSSNQAINAHMDACLATTCS